MRKLYLRFASPRTIAIDGAEIPFTEWHCLEVAPLATSGESPTKVRARDCARGYEFEAMLRDFCAWNKIFALAADFGGLGIHETVDLDDPSTSDGATIVVVAGNSRIRVPVKHLVPFDRHLHQSAVAV